MTISLTDEGDTLAPAYPAAVSRAADPYGGVLTIDLPAIVANHRALAARAFPARTAAVVKADAYGLGAAQVARALHDDGCRTFFVAHVEEGIRLRSALPTDATIFVLHGPPPGAEADCDVFDLAPVLNTREQVEGWIRFWSANRPAAGCAIQFDTGMTRFGLDLADAPLGRSEELTT